MLRSFAAILIFALLTACGDEKSAKKINPGDPSAPQAGSVGAKSGDSLKIRSYQTTHKYNDFLGKEHLTHILLLDYAPLAAFYEVQVCENGGECVAAFRVSCSEEKGSCRAQIYRANAEYTDADLSSVSIKQSSTEARTVIEFLDPVYNRVGKATTFRARAANSGDAHSDWVKSTWL